MKGKHWLAAALLACSALPLEAAVLLEISRGEEGRSAKLWLRDGQVAMEQKRGDEDTGMRYDVASRRMRVLTHQRREYMEFDPERIASMRKTVQGLASLMGGQGQGLMKQMLAAQMKDATPEQRAKIEQKMKRFMQPSSTAKKAAVMTAEATGKHAKAIGFDCREVALIRGGAVKQRACVAEASALGLSEGEAKALRSFFEFSRELQQAAGGVGGKNDQLMIDALSSAFSHGVPLELRNARGRLTSKVRKLERREAPAGVFDTPKDYKAGAINPF